MVKYYFIDTKWKEHIGMYLLSPFKHNKVHSTYFEYIRTTHQKFRIREGIVVL